VCKAIPPASTFKTVRRVIVHNRLVTELVNTYLTNSHSTAVPGNAGAKVLKKCEPAKLVHFFFSQYTRNLHTSKNPDSLSRCPRNTQNFNIFGNTRPKLEENV